MYLFFSFSLCCCANHGSGTDVANLANLFCLLVLSAACLGHAMSVFKVIESMQNVKLRRIWAMTRSAWQARAAMNFRKTEEYLAVER